MSNTCTSDNCNMPKASLDSSTLSTIGAVNSYSQTLTCHLGINSIYTTTSCTTPCNVRVFSLVLYKWLNSSFEVFFFFFTQNVQTISTSSCPSCSVSSNIFGCSGVLQSGSYSLCSSNNCYTETACTTSMCNQASSKFMSSLMNAGVFRSMVLVYAVTWLASATSLLN